MPGFALDDGEAGERNGGCLRGQCLDVVGGALVWNAWSLRLLVVVNTKVERGAKTRGSSVGQRKLGFRITCKEIDCTHRTSVLHLSGLERHGKNNVCFGMWCVVEEWVTYC